MKGRVQLERGLPRLEVNQADVGDAGHLGNSWRMEIILEVGQAGSLVK